MAPLTGSSTAEIDAPLERVWKLVEAVEQAPKWQGGLNAVHALERDADDRAVLCEIETDAKVRTVRSIVRFDYSGAPHELRWIQEKGDLKSVEGRWKLEERSDGRTEATYHIEADLGRMLGMVIRGPIVDLLRHMLAGARAGELKREIEAG